MENMPGSCYEGTQLASKNMKPVEHFVRRLSNKDHVELMKHIKPCAVKLDVLQETQNFKIRCLIHDRYRCRCINRNKRNVKCLFSCGGCFVQNDQIKDKEKHFRYKKKKINTSQSKQKKKIKSLNCVNREFSKDSCSPNKNVYMYSTSNIIQDISNDSSSRPLYSHNFNRDKILKPERCCSASHCDKLAGVFIDVGNNLEGIDYLLEEDNDIFKVSCETLFGDNKDIDYNLVKNVKIERYDEDTSKEEEINVQNLNAAVFSSSEIYTNSGWPGWSTNANVENMCDNFDSYDNEINVCSCYATTSIVGSGSGGFREVNVKEEETIEDVLVHQSTENVIPKFKVEMVNNKEVSIINESGIDIKLHAVNIMEEQPEISTNNSRFLDKISKTEITVLKTISSDFQEDCTERSDEVPDNSNIDNTMVRKPLKETEIVQTKKESHLKFQNEVQTLNRTFSDHQTTAKANSRDLVTTETREECVNRLSRKDENVEMKSKNYVTYRYERNEKSEYRRCYVCEVCNKIFISMSSLKVHKRLHTGGRLFVCNVCQKAFTRLDCLEIHKRRIHTGEKPFACTICRKAFARLSDLHRHKRTHTKPYICNFCDTRFSELSSLRKHKQRHNEDRPFGFSICRKEFAQLPSLEKHKQIHSEDLVTTETREECVNRLSRRDENVEMKSKNYVTYRYEGNEKSEYCRRYVCEVCNKIFKSMSSLKVHKRLHTGGRLFVCNVCQKAFTRLDCLEIHKRRIHTGEKPFACTICRKAFARLSDLHRHKRTHTKPYICNFCDARFSELSSLRKHKQRHNEDRPFGCSICRKEFAQLPNLEKHKCKLTGKRLFECSICGKAFKLSCHLKEHKQIHTGERPFSCSICGKTCINLSNLTEHKRIHTGERPFACTICGKEFRLSHHLKEHKRIHTGERPFNCSICG